MSNSKGQIRIGELENLDNLNWKARELSQLGPERSGNLERFALGGQLMNVEVPTELQMLGLWVWILKHGKTT